MKRILTLCALAVFFILAAPHAAQAYPLHADTSTWTRAELRTAVRSLETRNEWQARIILREWRRVARLRHELRDARAALELTPAPLTRDEMLTALELMPVTFAQLETFRAEGSTGGRIYIGE
jgi:hypothetical protein